MNREQLETLIHRYIDGTAREEEKTQLLNWYRSAEINDVFWPQGDDTRKDLHERILNRLKRDIQGKSSKVFSLQKLRVAATILVSIGLAVLAYYTFLPRADYYVVTNAAGHIREVQLPDSSKVWLNAGTTLKYNKAFINNRNLQLDGEAYFDVKHDPSHPFSIRTEKITTTVVGTSFSIKAYATDSIMNVVVTSGQVKIHDDNKSLALLSASQSLQYNNRTATPRLMTSDTTTATAWRRGELQFRGEALGEIAKSLERWYGYSIGFSDPDAVTCRYYMNFSGSDPIEKVLPVIAQLTGVKYEIDHENKVINLVGNACKEDR